MGEKKQEVLILATKVNYACYLSMRDNHIIPLLVETEYEEIAEDDTYIPLEGNTYILNIKYLKRLCRENAGGQRTKITKLVFEDGTVLEIDEAVDAHESDYQKRGIFTKGKNSKFFSMQKLVAMVYNEEEEIESPEKLTITSQIANVEAYQILRTNGVLPFIIEITDFMDRISKKPFDGIYTKMSHSENSNIMVISPFYIKKLINSREIIIDGIELDDNETYEIKEFYGEPGSDLGGIYINDDYISIERYAKKLLNPSQTKELKPDNRIIV